MGWIWNMGSSPGSSGGTQSGVTSLSTEVGPSWTGAEARESLPEGLLRFSLRSRQ